MSNDYTFAAKPIKQRVKILRSSDPTWLEAEINKFLEGMTTIVSIQYQMGIVDGTISNSQRYSALIHYIKED